MTDKQVLQMALKFIVSLHPAFICDAMNHTKKQRHTSLEPCPHVETQQQVAQALRQALEQQPADEPVAVVDSTISGHIDWLCTVFPKQGTKLYTYPQHAWVKLTDEEIEVIYEQHHNQYGECESVNWGYERAIEAKLKEKNT